MRSLGTVDHFCAGAVGDPGARSFFLEVGTGPEREWFLLEKQQVAGLAERLLEVIRPLGVSPQDPGAGLGDPIEPTFRVGNIGLGLEDDALVVLLESTEDDDSVAFTVEFPTADGAARQALSIVEAGRPECRFCGRPMDAEGHTCPSTNGDLRHDRS